MPRPHYTLDTLESAVLDRIARHRAERDDRASLSAGTLVVFVALTAGLVIGLGHAERSRSAGRGVESIVLADSARMAPSGLLASSQ
jgi:hypothetical protein